MHPSLSEHFLLTSSVTLLSHQPSFPQELHFHTRRMHAYSIPQSSGFVRCVYRKWPRSFTFCCRRSFTRFGVTGDDDNSLKDIQHKHNTLQAVHERALATNSANAKEVKYGVDPPFEIKSKPYSINLSLAPSVYNSIYSILQFAVLHNLSIPTNHIIY
jgi:hypothetical protein